MCPCHFKLRAGSIRVTYCDFVCVCVCVCVCAWVCCGLHIACTSDSILCVYLDDTHCVCVSVSSLDNICQPCVLTKSVCSGKPKQSRSIATSIEASAFSQWIPVISSKKCLMLMRNGESHNLTDVEGERSLYTHNVPSQANLITKDYKHQAERLPLPYLAYVRACFYVFEGSNIYI